MAIRLAKGNTAVIVGALHAGCETFFGYPITPASEIAHDASKYFPRVGRTFVQAESETAAINMVYGAAATGQRSMTASSGPGVSLMVEGISYMAAAELPGVIVDIMRAGPGLGNIGPEQSDYNQVVKGGGHGNYRNIVLAPNSVQEMCDFTRQAFDLAERYRTPVFVLADGVLGQMIEPLEFPSDAVTPTVDETWAVAANCATRPNLITSIYLDFDELAGVNQRLQEKYRRIAQCDVQVETWELDDAEVVVVAYGITSRVARSVAESFRANGRPVGLVRPITLWPFPTETLRRLADCPERQFLVAEMSNGQMIEDVRLATECRCRVELVNRMGGNVISVETMAERIEAMLR